MNINAIRRRLVDLYLEAYAGVRPLYALIQEPTELIACAKKLQRR